MIRKRPAPIASRIAISFCRDAARAINRLATFAHAISNTPPVSAINTQSGVDSISRKRGLPCAPGAFRSRSAGTAPAPPRTPC